uniref:Late expression factor 1 n=1 Tax=Spilarctia obliqua nucleopolyhedrovirus TaxID=1638618 RepID=A0A7G9U878_9ABAC|nr:late expression factor 1 [Spilarctia obliqua nucleopolyhedrovirus]
MASHIMLTRSGVYLHGVVVVVVMDSGYKNKVNTTELSHTVLRIQQLQWVL